MFNKHIGLLNRFAPLLARVFIGGMFLTSGIGKITGFSNNVAFVDAMGLPMASLLIVLAIIVEIVAGLSILIGYRIRWGATVLVLYTILLSFIFHADFTDQIQILFFTKNFAIVGGLLYMATYGAGALSHENKQRGTQSMDVPSPPSAI